MYLYLMIFPRSVNRLLDSFSVYTHAEAVCTLVQGTQNFGRSLETTIFLPFFLEVSPWGIFWLFAFEHEIQFRKEKEVASAQSSGGIGF